MLNDQHALYKAYILYFAGMIKELPIFIYFTRKNFKLSTKRIGYYSSEEITNLFSWTAVRFFKILRSQE